ncbi:RING/U-box [Suillus plorans]|uniref:RING/U-box n=1 Tax=Suillus plorans TaxID=116603 RepID=A0A9P7E388_9AGAM|nr:RING/U-box [Suillus plorans]KAG1809807.1 RING/U-box [Suillus plorans]
MKVRIKHWNAIAQWRWNTGNTNHNQDNEGDVCGICRVPYEGCCLSCKMTSGAKFECSHVFRMHRFLKWLGTTASKQQCPVDRRAWGACLSYVYIARRNCSRYL